MRMVLIAGLGQDPARHAGQKGGLHTCLAATSANMIFGLSWSAVSQAIGLSDA